MEAFRSSLERNDLKYFKNLPILKESKNNLDCDLDVYIDLDKLKEDFKIPFMDLDNMHVTEWHATAIDIKIGNNGNESELESELAEMHADLEA